MGRIVYTSICSLDGYINDRADDFSALEPDEELHAFVNEREKPVSTYVYGRLMYEVMKVWQHEPKLLPDVPVVAEYADLWRAATKLVVSRTLRDVETPRTTLWREVDADRLRALADAADGEVGIGSTGVAAAALAAGLVDEVSLYLMPVVLGGGTPALPVDAPVTLRLVEQRAFGSGAVLVRHEVVRPGHGAAV